MTVIPFHKWITEQPAAQAPQKYLPPLRGGHQSGAILVTTPKWSTGAGSSTKSPSPSQPTEKPRRPGPQGRNCAAF